VSENLNLIIKTLGIKEKQKYSSAQCSHIITNHFSRREENSITKQISLGRGRNVVMGPAGERQQEINALLNPALFFLKRWGKAACSNNFRKAIHAEQT
jgi:hypothetical protein